MRPLEILFKVDSCSKLVPIIFDKLIYSWPFVCKQSSARSALISLLVSVSSKIEENGIKCDQIKNILNEIILSSNLIHKPQVKIVTANDFPTPKSVEVPKKVNKKSTSIVNTVVENGEEYVVVKSNWKFNPRNLTENQKEKLQRKRDDIPALYQDLSQSQDEFRLTTWRTDSQDASNSSRSVSKSNTVENNGTATEILKNLPSSNVVPKIMENILSENDKKEVTKNNANGVAETTSKSKNKVDSIAVTTPNNTKSPRMALKDRVFRNVRNLLENSGNMDTTDPPVDLNKTENVINTPTQSKIVDSANIVNSAPPLLSAHRPSRVKRKPKKFDGLVAASAKKSRKKSTDQSSDDSSRSNSEKSSTTNAIEPLVESSVAMKEKTSAESITRTVDGEEPASLDEPKQSKDNAKKYQEVTKVSGKGDADNTKSRGIEDKAKRNMFLKNDVICVVHVEEQFGKADVKEENASENKQVPIENNVNCNDNNVNKSPNKKDRRSSEEPKSKDKFSKKDTSEKSQSPAKKDVSTPQQKTKGIEEQTSTSKKKTVRKSRIESELAIDTVEGHPFLKRQSQKRVTRKSSEAVSGDRRKSLANRLKSDVNNVDAKPKRRTRARDSDASNSSTARDDSPHENSNDQTTFSQVVPYSDDVIESSQDSSVTVTSAKSIKLPKKIPLVTLEKMNLSDKLECLNESQSILDCVIVASPKQIQRENRKSRDDIELPLNKTVEEKSQGNLTENIDTEPIENNRTFTDVIILDDDSSTSPLTVSDEIVVGPETQEIAEADTQPTDPKEFMDPEVTYVETSKSVTIDTAISNITENKTKPPKDRPVTREVLCTNDLTITLTDPVCIDGDKETASSPSSFEDEQQKRKDFLNNTLEISPIKNVSPDRNKKSPSPDTSNDYVVIKLTSPVHSNGEPYEKCSSPEVFTDDKGSPDTRDQSPPRVEVTMTNTSPSSSLSLKKNRPQVRSCGRAAQMLGLCVPDKVQAIINPERNETEEAKINNNSSTPVRRNLRNVYNSASENVDPTENVGEHNDRETFLKFQRSIPAVDSSPSCPILKRKLIEIVDDGTISPVSKVSVKELS